MATPAAILSVLVQANSSAATATLTKFDKQMAATNEVARKGIEARLSGTFNESAFKAYDERLARAARGASDRAAFKAELGANFNNAAFKAYERALDKAEREAKAASERTRRFSLGGSLGTGGSLVAAAAGAAGAYTGLQGSLAALADFQRQIEMVHTQAGATQAEVDRASKAIQGMAASVGTGPNALAESFYHAFSGG